MRTLCLSILTASIVGCAPTSSPVPPPQSALPQAAPSAPPSGDLDPENATLPDVCAMGTGTIRAKGGVGEYDSKLGEGMRGSFEIHTIGRADLDGDGTVEILAYVLCQPGGSGTLDALWAFHASHGALERVASIAGGDRANGGLAKVALEGKSVVVTRNAGGDAACCADKTAMERWTFSKDRFVRDPSAAPAPPAPAPNALAQDLLRARTKIGWSASKKQIVHATTVEEEGTGTVDWQVHFINVETGKDDRAVHACGGDKANNCTEARLEAFRPELEKQLDGFVAIDGVDVVAGKAAMLPGSDVWIRVDGPRVSLAKKDGAPTKQLATLSASRPHKPLPARLWLVPERRAVVGRITMSPGNRFGEFNVFEEIRVFPLPAR